MLIEFRYKNFRSFYDKMVFSMQKSQIREQSEKIIKKKCNNSEFELLPTKVIYGVNASGKSSLVKGLELLQDIVNLGSISDTTKQTSINNLPIYHFIHSKKEFFSPMELGISFITNNKLFDYTIEISNYDTGEKYECKITKEILKVNNIVIFIRNNNKVDFNPNNDHNFKKNIDINAAYLEQTEKLLDINDYTIFTRWFNLNKEIVNDFSEWFIKQLKVFNSVDEIIPKPSIVNEKVILNIIRRVVKEADFGPQEISFITRQTGNNSEMVSLKSKYRIYDKDNTNDDFGIECPSLNMESLGTIKLIRFILPFLDSIMNGTTLVIDELDSSIHPEVIAAIIRCFADPEVNTSGAQLVFTTHNPVFLNVNLFRRDEIVFVEKDSETYKSDIYTLDEYARSDANYLKNYLEEKYINFTNIDFVNIIKEIGRAKIDDSKENNSR